MQTSSLGPRGAFFLDRDGVINVLPVARYVTAWDQFRFLPGVLPALRKLSRDGRRLIVISNQSGVGRGVMSRRTLTSITRRMVKTLQESGSRIDAIYYCTHAPEAGCRCRKPGIGLLRRASRRFHIDLKRSFVIGDNGIDIRMGKAAGCRTVLVLTGMTSRRQVGQLSARPDRIVRNLPEAVRWVLADGKKS